MRLHHVSTSIFLNMLELKVWFYCAKGVNVEDIYALLWRVRT